MSEPTLFVPIRPEFANKGHPIYSADYHPAKLIELMTDGKTAVQVSAVFGISKQSFHKWREKYPEFEEAYQIARTYAQAYWERLNEAGAKGEISNFNATAMIFRMRNQFREDYTESKQVNITSNNLIVSLSDADLMKRIQDKIKNHPELLEAVRDNPLIEHIEETGTTIEVSNCASSHEE